MGFKPGTFHAVCFHPAKVPFQEFGRKVMPAYEVTSCCNQIFISDLFQIHERISKIQSL